MAKKSFLPYRDSKTGLRMLFAGGENFGTGSFDERQRRHHGQVDVNCFPKVVSHINRFVVLKGKVVKQTTSSAVMAFPVEFYEN